MKELLMKDFRLIKFLNLFSICACLIFGYIGVSSEDIFKSKLLYVFIVFMIAYMASMFLSQHDVKANIDTIINSLPINRSSVVKAKYLFMALYISIACTIIFLSSNVSKLIFASDTPGTPASIIDILFIIGLALFFYSIYFPIYYISIGKAQAFNQIFYMLLILTPAILNKFGEKIVSLSLIEYIVNLDFNLLIPIFTIIVVILYFISLNISKRIYKAKEF